MADNNKIDSEDIRILRDQTDALREAYNLRVNLTTEAKSQLSLSRQLNKFAQDQLANQSETLSLSRKSKDIKKDINKANDLEAKLTNEIKAANHEKKLILKEQLDLTTKIKAQLEKEAKSAKNVENAFGITGNSLKSVNKLLGGALGDTDGILENTRLQLSSMEKQGKLAGGIKGKFQGLGILTGQIGKSLISGLSDPLTYILALFANSKAITQFQNELGVSYGHSINLRDEMSQIAHETGDVFINSKKIQESFITMNKEMGFIVDYSGQTLETFTNLDKRLGLGAKAAANMTMMFKLQGDNTEEIASNTIDALTAQIKMGNVALTGKQILGEVANAADSIKVSLNANPIAIGNAIIAAKQLGAELKDIDAIAGSLLDFESSISAELEAELLTGKQLNLEKARLMALNNDLEGVAKEVAKQGLDYNFMTTANRIEQEAAAKALGMSREQLSKITMEEAFRNKSAQEIKDTMGDQAYEQFKALDAQTKFTEGIAKIKTLFTDVMVILTPIIDGVALLADGVGKVVGIFGNFTPMLLAAIPLISRFSAIMRLTAMHGLKGAITGIFQTFSKIPFGLGIPIALGAIGGLYSMYNKANSMNDGVIGSDGGMLVSGPKGSIQLNKDDSIIAGTNLGGGNTQPAPMTPIIVKSVTQFDSFGANNPAASDGRFRSYGNHETSFV